jgi:predicted RND superfamily exporter protein
LAAKITDSAPVVADIADFDLHSGSMLERLLFNHRPVILLLCLLTTLFLGFQATRTRLNADFDSMIPTHHPFIVNYFTTNCSPRKTRSGLS